MGTFFPFLGSFSSRQIENTINHCGVAEPGARSRPTPLSSFARAGAFDVTRSRQLLHSFKRYVFQSGSFFSETILGPPFSLTPFSHHTEARRRRRPPVARNAAQRLRSSCVRAAFACCLLVFSDVCLCPARPRPVLLAARPHTLTHWRGLKVCVVCRVPVCQCPAPRRTTFSLSLLFLSSSFPSISLSPPRYLPALQPSPSSLCSQESPTVQRPSSLVPPPLLSRDSSHDDPLHSLTFELHALGRKRAHYKPAVHADRPRERQRRR